MRTANHPIARFISAILLLTATSCVFAAERFGHHLCQSSSDYDCLKVQKGDSWESLWSNSTERDIVMRVNRMNTPIYAGMTLAVPKNLSSDSIMDVAPFEQQINVTGEKLLIFKPSLQAWGAYDEEGRLVRWGPASGGSNYCKDLGHQCHTPVGSFRIYNKGGEGCYSSKFPLPDGGAPMPYCMYFKGGNAFHGEPDGHGLPGYNASHGCVRILIDDAEWLNHEFVDLPGSGHGGTKVIVQHY